MAVTVLVKATGEKFTGKFATVEAGQVGLFSGIMSDKKGGFRGCGKKTSFAAEAVEVQASQPELEIRERQA